MSTPILVTGADGMLGSAVVQAAQRNGIEVVALSKQDLDISSIHQVERILKGYNRPIVINCAGIVRERADENEARTIDVNSLGPQLLALFAGRLVHVSSDCVFDGTITEGDYNELAAPCPPDLYGRSKLRGEVKEGPHLTVRVSFVGLGPRGLLHWLLMHPEGVEVPGYTNWFWNGWTASALACILLPMAVDPGITGLVHIPGPEILTKWWLVDAVARRLRPDLTVVETLAPEVRWMVLGSKMLDVKAPETTWAQMLDELEEEYRGLQTEVH